MRSSWSTEAGPRRQGRSDALRGTVCRLARVLGSAGWAGVLALVLAVALARPVAAQTPAEPNPTLPEELVVLLRQIPEFGEFNCAFIVGIDGTKSMDVGFAQAKRYVMDMLQAYAVGGDAVYAFTFGKTPCESSLVPIEDDGQSIPGSVMKVNQEVESLPANEQFGTDNFAALNLALDVAEQSRRNALILIFSDVEMEGADTDNHRRFDERCSAMRVQPVGTVSLAEERRQVYVSCYARFPNPGRRLAAPSHQGPPGPLTLREQWARSRGFQLPVAEPVDG
ncbi:MAG: vWA domain-containing protein, partial [Candidatus Eremiobacterota bacterium]